MTRRTPREAAERIIVLHHEVYAATIPPTPFEPEQSSDYAVILAVEYLREHPNQPRPSNEWRCNICGGLVRFDGTKPGE